MVERSAIVTLKPAFASQKAVLAPAGPPPTMRIWCIFEPFDPGVLICEE